MNEQTKCIPTAPRARPRWSNRWRVGYANPPFFVSTSLAYVFEKVPIFVLCLLGVCFVPSAAARRERTRLALGLLLLCLALSMLGDVVPETVALVFRASATMLAGVCIGGSPRENPTSGGALRRAVGLALVLAGMALGIGLLGGPYDLFRPFSPLVYRTPSELASGSYADSRESPVAS